MLSTKDLKLPNVYLSQFQNDVSTYRQETTGTKRAINLYNALSAG
jgi:hypothetical protein